MFDTHCHLQADAFDSDREAVFSESEAAGVTHFLVPATDRASFPGTIKIAAERERAFCALGIHPHSATEWGPDVRDFILRECSTNPKVAAVGEIGLDYHYDFSPRDVQRKAFSEQIELAIGLRKPIVIHTRESDDDVFRIVEDHYSTLPPDAPRGQFHCFSGNLEQMQKAVALGFFVSFTGNITFRNSTLSEVVRETPLDRILIETDSPYLAPVPFRGKRNSPVFLRMIAEKIAELKATDISIIMQETFENAIRLFRISRSALVTFLILASLAFAAGSSRAQRNEPAGKAPPDSVLTAERRKAEELRKKQEQELAKAAELRRQDSVKAAAQEQEQVMAKVREQMRQDSIKTVERLADEEKHRLFLETPMPWRAVGIGSSAGIGSMHMSVIKPEVSATSVLAYGLQLSSALTRRLDVEVGYAFMDVGDNFPQDSVYNYGPGRSASFKYSSHNPNLFNSEKGGVTWLVTGEDLKIAMTSIDFRYVITQPSAFLSFYLGIGFSHIAMTSSQRYHRMLDSATASPIEETFNQSWSRNGIKLLFGMRHDFELGKGFTLEPFGQIAAIGAFQGQAQDNAFVFVPDRDQIIMTHLNIGATIYFGWFGVPRQ